MWYSMPLMIAGLAGVTNETIDRLLLKYLLPTDADAQIGLYGAFYKLSIIMTLFVQTFRFAAEPFFFNQEGKQNAKRVYADVMKYFTIITAIIFLTVTVYYDIAIGFIGKDYHDERGATIVPILLLANLFLGIYYNLAVWFKLTEKTKYGAYLAIFGAVITLALNIVLIPQIGFVGSAWATLVCYAAMMVASYFMGRKHYPIPYNIKRIGGYLILMMSLFLSSHQWDMGMLFNTVYILVFVGIVLLIEKPKKRVNSTPELFD